ncbi:MAG: DUF488 domain-containing protein [Patescibacteria group bacterium]|nr:DUF488 domain-containing protein [Patescibacteria group bacterium]
MKPIIYTVGHSTRSIAEFIEILKAHGIRRVVDIRTIPKSRHNPQFGEGQLKKSLRKAKIAYRHEPLLGGLRRARKDSVNLGWENLSFRGFADYMQTDDFEKGLEKLQKLAMKSPTTVMCAEAVPWRCHRSLVADALKKKKWRVLHIMSRTSAHEHKYTSFLRSRNGKLIYPGSKT